MAMLQADTSGVPRPAAGSRHVEVPPHERRNPGNRVSPPPCAIWPVRTPVVNDAASEAEIVTPSSESLATGLCAYPWFLLATPDGGGRLEGNHRVRNHRSAQPL